MSRVSQEVIYHQGITAYHGSPCQGLVSTKIISLTSNGAATVSYGVRDDPNRLTKIVGDRACRLDYRGDGQFLEINRWKEGDHHVQLSIINFRGQTFECLAHARARMSGMPALEGCLYANFPELMSDLLWENLDELYMLGVYWVVAPSPEASWRRWRLGRRCAPFVGTSIYTRFINVGSVWRLWDERIGFLVYREVAEPIKDS